MKSIYYIHDARKITELIKTKLVDVVITSPPYFDLKNYGHTKNQIGYKQKYDKYLDDISKVFAQCQLVTKKTGALWMVVDAFKKNGTLTLLPFDIIDKLKKDTEWRIREIIIWKKDKTLPYKGHGEMRNIFEYVLFFTRSDKFEFNVDAVKSVDDLKEWWKRYPERYNPGGKTPENVWEFPIPTQGSWGKEYLRHFCPLPTQLIERMILLSSSEGDVVMDPFAGSGAVLAQAHFMKRKYIGFDINTAYRRMFQRYLVAEFKNGRSRYDDIKNSQEETSAFRHDILKLRQLKYPKLLMQLINNTRSAHLLKDISAAFVFPGENLPNDRHGIEIVLLFRANVSEASLEKTIQTLTSRPPLSKFGLEPRIQIVSTPKQVLNFLKKPKLQKTPNFLYEKGVTHSYSKKMKINELSEYVSNVTQAKTHKKYCPIFSPIKIKIS